MKTMSVRKFAAWVVLSAFSFSGAAPWALAETSMDLSSTAHQVPAGSVLGTGTAAISVGGHQRLLTPSATLTPAEAVAVQQVMATGRQTLQLGALGNAIGGSFVVNAQAAALSNLVIPQGVQAIANFTNHDALNVTGNVVDMGALYALSTSQLTKSANLNALGINVGQGGLLTSVLSPAVQSAYQNAVPNLSLNLNALNDIVNKGTISSAGDLSLKAGSGSITNSGVIAAANGNVNFSGAANKELVINNVGGHVEAANNITVRDANYAGTNATTLTGGDWLSQRLDVNGGMGEVNVNVQEVSGKITTSADTAHITAATKTLNLGDQCITGDPTFYNKAGDIRISGLVTANEDIAIIASGNITTQAGDVNAQVKSNGHNITLIAGAHIDDSTCVGCTDSTTLPPGSAIPSGQTIGITAPSGGEVGGNISLNFSAQPAVIDSSSTTGTGGKVNLIAFRGTSLSTGAINLSSSGINTSGITGGGDVTAIGSAISGQQSFTAGFITTNGGNVSISSATPVVPAGTTANSTGQLNNQITAGALTTGSLKVTGNIDAGSQYGKGGSVTLQDASGFNFQVGGAVQNGVIGQIITAGVDSTQYGDVTINYGGDSSTTVEINSPINARNVSVTAPNIVFNGGNKIQAFGTNGSDGIVTLAGNGQDSGMRINAFTGTAGKFNVTSTALSSIKTGTLLLKDATGFDLQSGLDLTAATTSYNLTMIGTSPSAQFTSVNQTINSGTKNVTIFAGGGIGNVAGNGLRIVGSPFDANAGSITLISGKDIGNSSGNFQFVAGANGSTGEGGNVTLVAGADNVTASTDGSTIQINPNTGSATGGSIVIPAQAFSYTIYTTGHAHGGDVTLVAYPGTTPDSGQVSVASTQTQFAIEAGAFNSTGSGGNVTIIAGATSTLTAGGGTGYTISTGPIGTNYSYGNLLLSTAIPNSGITIKTTGSSGFGGGNIIAGTFTGGTPVDGAISTYAIGNANNSTSITGINNVTLLSGSNAVAANSAIKVNNIFGSSNVSRPVDFTLISGVAGMATPANNYNINTGVIQGNGATSIYVSSADSISIGSDGFARSLIGGTKPITLIAGTAAKPGNINVAGGILASSSNVGIVSLGTSGNIFVGGSGGNGSINVNGPTAGGSVAITTLNGTITTTGNIATTGNTTNGDVLLSSGSSAATSITIANTPFGILTGLSNTATPLPGQIYIITNTGTGQSNVSTANTTQSANGRAANPVLVALGSPFSIGAGTQNIVFTPNNIAAGQGGGVSGYSAGGFLGISDSGGASDIRISIGGTITDNKLFLPIVSSGSFSLGNNAGSKIQVLGASKGAPELLFAGASGVQLGTNTNPIQLTTNGLGNYTFSIASNNGAIAVNNNVGPNPIDVKTVLGNTTAAITNQAAGVNVQAPHVVPQTYQLTTNGSINLNASVTAPQAISINAGTASITGGLLNTSSLSLSAGTGIGSAGSVGTTAATVSLNDASSSIDSLILYSSASVSANPANRLQFKLFPMGYNSLLTVATPINGNLITMQTAAGRGGSISLLGNISSSLGVTISADADISAGAVTSIISQNVTLTATTGSIGSSTNPIAVNNGTSGVQLAASAGNGVFITDNNAENIFLNNITPLTAGRTFQLTSGGSISTVYNAPAITSPTIALTAAGNVSGAAGSTLQVASGLGSNLSLFVSSGNTASISDTSTDTVILRNGLVVPSATNSFSLVASGNVAAQSASRTAVNSPDMHLISIAGNIGSSVAPLIVSSGNPAARLQLEVRAEATTSGNGNVYVADYDLDPNASTFALRLNGARAGNGAPADATNGNFQVTVPNGSLESLASIFGSSNVTLFANGTILNYGVPITSDSISVTSASGNLGSSSFPLAVLGSQNGAHVTATGTQIYLQAIDTNPLFLQNVSSFAANIANPAGDVSVNGLVQSATTLNVSGKNIVHGGGALQAATITLSASGGIGSFATPLSYTTNDLNITAADPINGKVYIAPTNGNLGLNSSSIGNLLYVTVPGTVNISILSPYNSIPNLGLISQNGDVILDTFLQATGSIFVSANQSITSLGTVLLSPTISLNATNGNIGGALAVGITSGGGGSLNLTATAPANTAGSGNINIVALDADPLGGPALIINGVTAGSGTAVDGTTGNLTIASPIGSIGFNGNVTATSNATLTANGGITNLNSSTLFAPNVILTATTGNIGSISAPILLASPDVSLPVRLTATATANTSGNGNVYVASSSNDPSGSSALVINTSKAGSGTPVDSTTGTFSATTSVGSITIAGNITGTNALILDSAAGISATGSATLLSQSIVLSTNAGNIGTSSAPILVSTPGIDLSLTANASGTATGTGNIFLQDKDVASKPIIINSSTALGNVGDATSGNFTLITDNTDIQIGTGLTASNSVSLDAGGGIYRPNGVAVDAPNIALTARTGNIGTNAAFILVSSSGSSPLALTLNATANTTNNGNVYIANVGSAGIELGTSQVGSGTPVDATTGHLSINGATPPIAIAGNVKAAADIGMSADNLIQQPNGLLVSPKITLLTGGGNIGSSSAPIEISGGGEQVRLYVVASASTAGNGNIYIKDEDADPTGLAALRLDYMQAGSSGGAEGTLSVTAPNGSILFNSNASAVSLIDISAKGSILSSPGAVLAAPQINLTSAQGDIGTSFARIQFSGAMNSTALAPSNGNVYLLTADPSFTLANSSNLLDLLVNQSVGVSKVVPAAVAGTPVIRLSTFAGSNGDITIDDNLTASEISLIADRSIVPSGTNALKASTISLTATNGNIGNGSAKIRVQALDATGVFLSVAARATTAGNGNIYVTSDQVTAGRPLYLVDAAAGTGTSTDPTNGKLDVSTFANDLIVSGTARGAYSASLRSGKNILALGTLGTVVLSPRIELVALGGGSIGTNGGGFSTLRVGNGGNGLQSLSAFAQGSVDLLDNFSESVTLNNTAGNVPLVGTTSVTLSTLGNIAVTTDGALAINAPNINLSVLGGNITSDGTASGAPILIASNGSPTGLLLSVSATNVSGVGGTVNLKNIDQQDVTLANSSTPVSADVSFSLAHSGNIKASNQSLPAISSPQINLGTIAGNISGDGTASGAPLVLQSGSSVGVTLSINAGSTDSANGFGSAIVSNEFLTIKNSSGRYLQFTDDAGVDSFDITADTVLITTGNFNALGALTSNSASGGVVINGSAGGLQVGGSGVVSSLSQIVLTAFGTDSIQFAGTPVFSGNTVLNAIGGTASVLSGAGPIVINGNLTANVNNTFAINDFDVSGSTTVNFPASGASLGTLVNTTGDILLGSKTIVNSGGKNIAIIAKGNVTASGATTVNLSGGAKSSGGNLTIIAGYDFTPGSGGQILDSLTPFVLTGVSSTGGNINLPKLTVNTSSTAAASLGGNAGNITMVAAAGTEATGNIIVGGLTATSTNGSGGNVTLIGEGGVIVKGNIATTGKTAGGSVTISGSKANFVGPVVVQDGYVLGGLITPGTPTSDKGAAAIVTGTIKTNSTLGAGGAVTIAANQQVSTGAITTTGLVNGALGTAGGTVSMQSLDSYVKVGAIAANALNAKTSASAGTGGSIVLYGNSGVSTGNLLANGGNNTGTGDGGNGGSVSIATGDGTNSITNALFKIGTVNVKGYINTSGGTAVKTGTADGGVGGNVTIDAASVAITASTGGNSILASGGAGTGGGINDGGIVSLTTYSIQPLVTALDLTSTTRNVVALPGGMFSVGTAGSPNGVAGNIKSDITMTKSVAPNGFILDGSTNVGKVTVTVKGGDGSFTETIASTPTVVNVPVITGTKRTLLTPAEALALFQTSRGDISSQTLTVSTTASTKGGIATSGSAELSAHEVGGQSFSAFKLPANVKLEFSGKLPVVNLPASTLLAGELNFKDPLSFGFVNTGSGALTIAPTGKLTADLSSVVGISGTAGTLTNNGTISVGGLVLYRPGSSALTFKTTGQTESFAGLYIDPQSNGSSTITVNVSGGTSTGHVAFQHLPLTTMYSPNAQTAAANAAKLPTVALTFSMIDGQTNPIEVTLDGILNAGTLTVKGTSATFNKQTRQTPITIGSGAEFTVATAMKISSTGALKVGNSDLTAGKLAPNTDLNSTIPAANITSKGSIVLTSTGVDGITFNVGATITNNGALLQIVASAPGALINLGSNNQFFDNGGNVSILSKGNVTGPANNQFNAVGITGTASGGIEIGAGTTTSSLAKALAAKPTSPPPTVPGANIVPNANGKQVLLLPGGITNISLGNGTTTNSTLDFTKQGAMVFNTVGSGSITLNQATFTTISSKPVSAKESTPTPTEEFVLDTDADDSDFELVKVSR